MMDAQLFVTLGHGNTMHSYIRALVVHFLTKDELEVSRVVITNSGYG